MAKIHCSSLASLSGDLQCQQKEHPILSLPIAACSGFAPWFAGVSIGAATFGLRWVKLAWLSSPLNRHRLGQLSR